MKFTQRGNSFIYSISIPNYLALIEKGVQSHYVSHNIIEASMRNFDSTTGKTAKSMGIAPPYYGSPFYWQYKGPFIKPAFKALEMDIPRILEKQINKAISLKS